jgi:hypothetical protein
MSGQPEFDQSTKRAPQAQPARDTPAASVTSSNVPSPRARSSVLPRAWRT